MELRDTIRTYRLFSGSYDIVFGPVFHPGRKEAVRVANDRPSQRILEVQDLNAMLSKAVLQLRPKLRQSAIERFRGKE